MNVKEIVRNWLRENNCDGLYDDDCACDLETLMDCYDGRIPGCMPGVKGPCNCNKGHDDHIAPKETED